MMETKITCDGCNEEISATTNYSQEAYIQMSPVFKPGESDYRFAMNGPVPIRKIYQFHDLRCVKMFLGD